MGRSGNQLGRTIRRRARRILALRAGSNDYVYIFAQPQMWKAFLGVMGRPELADDGRYATPEARWENRDAVEQGSSPGGPGSAPKHEVMKLMGRCRSALRCLSRYG